MYVFERIIILLWKWREMVSPMNTTRHNTAEIKKTNQETLPKTQTHLLVEVPVCLTVYLLTAREAGERFSCRLFSKCKPCWPGPHCSKCCKFVLPKAFCRGYGERDNLQCWVTVPLVHGRGVMRTEACCWQVPKSGVLFLCWWGVCECTARLADGTKWIVHLHWPL